ncbi:MULTISPECIES: helix-turn-helix domain-containing protein [Pelistega]|uniref:helix-turn-helix domain-containing protein n=1 Tax=Pelistega TaxID=106146 RepID=UPI001FE08686|nr:MULTISPECIES: helix-turn-helix domain-containing protein [Pelistega]
MPNGEQIRSIKQFCGCSRFVFNRALAWQNEQYEQDNNFSLVTLKSLICFPNGKKSYSGSKNAIPKCFNSR